jgi:hypothetical protein
MGTVPALNVAVLTSEAGVARVLGGELGMTFVIDNVTPGRAGPVAHVRDYRNARQRRPFQIWSLPADGYHVLLADGSLVDPRLCVNVLLAHRE